MNKETIEGITISIVAVAIASTISWVTYLIQTTPDYHPSALKTCIERAAISHRWEIQDCEVYISNDDDRGTFNDVEEIVDGK